MTIADLQQYVPWVTAGGGLLGGLGSAFPMARWLEHRRESIRIANEAEQAERKQSDGVALALVAKLEDRLNTVEAALVHERELCDAKLEVNDARITAANAKIASLEGMIDSLITTIELAPEKAVEAIAAIKVKRAQRKLA